MIDGSDTPVTSVDLDGSKRWRGPGGTEPAYEGSTVHA